MQELVRKNHKLKTTLQHTKGIMRKAMSIIKNEKEKFVKLDTERVDSSRKAEKPTLESIVGEVKSFVHEFEE